MGQVLHKALLMHDFIQSLSDPHEVGIKLNYMKFTNTPPFVTHQYPMDMEISWFNLILLFYHHVRDGEMKAP